MERTPLLCDVLLGHISDKSVADVVFSRSTGGDAVQMTSGLSDEIALKHYKGDIKKAATAVRATTSEQVLAKFAKDPRSSVRRAVAANPHLGMDARLYLHGWGHAKDDTEILRGVLPHMPVREALAALPSMTIRRREYPWAQLAEAVRNDGTAEAYRLAREANHHELNLRVVGHLYGGSVEGFPLESYLEGFDASARAELLVSTAKSVRTLSAEFVDLVVAHGEEVAAQVRSGGLFPRLRAVAPDAVKKVLGSDLELLWVGLAQTKVGPHVVHRLLEKNSEEVTTLLATQQHRALTLSMAEKAAPTIAAGRDGYVIGRFLRDVQVPLSSDAVLTLLRGGNRDVTESWLSGNLPHRPRPGEITALLAEPASAFAHTAGYYRRQVDNPTTADIAQRLVYAIPGMLNERWSVELVDALGEHFFDLARSNGDLAKYLARRLERAFGSDVSLWEVALTLTGSWTSGLSELIDASFLATGRIPPTFEDPAPPAPPVNVTQLSFLEL